MADSKDELTQVEATKRSGLVSNPVYAVTVDISDVASNQFTTETLVTFDSSRDRASTFIDLKADEVTEITLNGKPVDVSHWADSRIKLESLAQGSNILRVKSVHTYADDGQGLTRVLDDTDGNKPYLHTQFEHFSAHTVFACFDQPDIKGTFSWSIKAPETWTVLNNKPEASRTTTAPDLRPGAAQWNFPASEKISTYLTAFVAGPFHAFTTDPIVTKDGRVIPVALYCRESQASLVAPDADEWFALLKGENGKPGAVRILGDKLGIEYPYSQLLQVIVPGFQAGAMENPGLVTYAEQTIMRGGEPLRYREWRANAIVHETVHQWFGDLTTPRWWNGIWLNESFATWGADVITPLVSRYRNGAIQRNNGKTKAAALDQKVSTHAIEQPLASTSDVDAAFDPLTYEKGSAVIAQLGEAVGEETVWRGLREFYFPAHAEGNATLEDFLGALGQAAGVDLTGWAQRWLEQPGINVLKPGFKLDTAGNFSDFVIEQTAATPKLGPELRDHTLRVGLYDTAPSGAIMLRKSIPVRIAGPVTAVPGVDGERQPDLLLLNDGDLTYTKVILDPRSRMTAEQRLDKVVEPLARKQLWNALWNMTRDGQMPAQNYVACALRFTASEPDLTTVESVLNQVRYAIDSYVASNLRDDLRAQVADLALRQLQSGGADPQRQVNWMATYVATAVQRDNQRRVQPIHADLLRGLLDGSRSLAGIDVSPGTSQRWAVVTALARAARISRTEIDQEAAKDDSLLGQADYLRAWAALPNDASKREAYRLLTAANPRPGDPQMTPQNLRALIEGFKSDRSGLMTAYRRDYPRMVAVACRKRSEKEVADLVPGMYPGFSRATLTVARQALAQPGVPQSAQRYIREGMDDTERALRAQAVSRGSREIASGQAVA